MPKSSSSTQKEITAHSPRGREHESYGHLGDSLATPINKEAKAWPMINNYEDLQKYINLCGKHDNQSSWMSVEPMEPEGYYGFTYVLRLLPTNRLYVGQKVFYYQRKLQPLKGKKRKRKTVVPSGWENYCGSSDSFTEALKEHGSDCIEKYHIHSWETKHGLGLGEADLMSKLDVLIAPHPADPEEFRYYNKWTSKVFRPQTAALAEYRKYRSKTL